MLPHTAGKRSELELAADEADHRGHDDHDDHADGDRAKHHHHHDEPSTPAEKVGGLFSILGSLGVGCIAFTAIMRIHPILGVSGALFFGICGFLTECVVFWRPVRWSFNNLASLNRYREYEIRKDLVEPPKTKCEKDRLKKQIREEENSSKNLTRHWKIDLALFLSFIIGLGFAAIAYTHSSKALISFGMAATMAHPVAMFFCAFAGIAYSLFFYCELYRWSYEDSLLTKFTKVFARTTEKSSFEYWLKFAGKFLIFAIVCAINFYAIATTADTWLHAGYHFFKHVNLAAYSTILSDIVIGVFVLPINLILSIEVGFKSIQHMWELTQPSAESGETKTWLQRLGTFFSLLFSTIIISAHFYSEGAVAGEEFSGATRIFTTIMGFISEFLFDLHYVVELLGKSTEHQDCDHNHDVFGAIKDSCLYIYSSLKSCVCPTPSQDASTRMSADHHEDTRSSSRCCSRFWTTPAMQPAASSQPPPTTGLSSGSVGAKI